MISDLLPTDTKAKDWKDAVTAAKADLMKPHTPPT